MHTRDLDPTVDGLENFPLFFFPLFLFSQLLSIIGGNARLRDVFRELFTFIVTLFPGCACVCVCSLRKATASDFT